ncbi:MAG: K(+)-transporting ATPase subunit C [Deltaproteobacteria bacterium]
MQAFIIALRATLVTLILTGLAYPLVVTAGAQLVFPHRANGSLVVDDHGHEVGSELIGQGFADPAYAHPRPSVSGYDAANSSGTNLGPTSKKLRDGQPDDPATKDVDESFTGIKDLVAAYRTENGLAASTEVPADAVTRSASGIDPDISPDNARLQAQRIATARGVAVDRVRTIIEHSTEGRDLGFLGEDRINVLALNLALDRTFGRPARAAGDGGTLPK